MQRAAAYDRRMSGMARKLFTAALALAVLALPATAHSEVVHGPEPVGDTVAWSYEDVADPFCGTPAAVESPPEAAESDLTGVSVRHKRFRISLTARFAAPQPTSWRNVEFDLQTPSGRWTVDFTRKGKRFVDLTPEPTWTLEEWDVDDDGTTDCQVWIGMVGWSPCSDRPRVSISDDRRAMRVVIARHCLGNPHWIQAGATSHGSFGTTAVKDTWDPSGPDVRDLDWDPYHHVYGPRVLAGPEADTIPDPEPESRVARRTTILSMNGLMTP